MVVIPTYLKFDTCIKAELGRGIGTVIAPNGVHKYKLFLPVHTARHIRLGHHFKSNII